MIKFNKFMKYKLAFHIHKKRYDDSEPLLNEIKQSRNFKYLFVCTWNSFRKKIWKHHI